MLDPNTCYPPLGGGDFRDFDFKDPIDQHLTGPHADHCREMIDEAYDAEPIYDLALAAFTVFGMCELSRIALQRGVKKNPIVLRKDYKCSSRPMNGSETAQDYLYLSQELWSEPAAFAFASADPEVRAGRLKPCNECKKKEAANGEHKCCAACKMAVYCSSECPKANWSEPKAACKMEQQFIKHMQLSSWT